MIGEFDHLEGIRIALETCLGVKPTEEVLIIGDSERVSIANSFAEVSSSLGAETILSIIKPRKLDGNEPPKTVAAAMKNADVILIPTTKSLSHTQAREEACREGARVASMPGITKEMIKGPMKADYKKIKSRSDALAKKLTESKEAKIKTEIGTELVLNLKGRTGISDSGILRNKGDFGNLPAGEAYIAPVENTGKGKIIIDTVITTIGKLSKTVECKIESGSATEIIGGTEANTLKKMLKEAGDTNSNKIAELGIGTNPQAEPMGSMLIDEKIMGTVHIAFGDNSHMGGKQKSNIHIDCIISNPTLKLDRETIIKDGKWKIDF